MDFAELVKNRYSVRAYKSDPVPDEWLHQVLEAARLAPTAANRQPFRVLVIRTTGREQELNRIYKRDWFVQAPLVLAMVGVPGENWVRMDGRNYNFVDTAIAMDHLVLAAANLGLGTCWIAAFNPAEARQVLNLPDEVEPVAFTPLGFPADTPGPKKRKALEDLVIYERWS